MAVHGLLFVGLIISLVSIASADDGFATYYTTYFPSACYGYQDEGDMIAAASDAIWDNGGACGSYYSVTCIGPDYDGPNTCYGSVTVMIVDYCPPGCAGTIDLSEQAFSAIADTSTGKIIIIYY
ncbi:DPBB_1 domain-containing protein [Cephalotus follicularis]|uniref:DPBB_1 domain-containing protein n=1 Tax=Cephalotus follicularis TaxID=3775 RepID=A0A1Q3B7H8_CEPFO|nr:DPBB_1 domain-containing protein [Cephalotus follicularis]